MKVFFGLIFFALTLGMFSFAAPANPSSGKTLFSPGLAIPIALDTGETGAGLSLGLLWQTEGSAKLYAGADLGLHFLGKVHSLTESTTALQLLPTLVYFLTSKGSLTPFLGVSAGAYWYVAQAAGFPGIDFLFLVRPGLMVQAGESTSLSVEAKYGGLGGDFVVLPTLSVNLKF